MPGRPDEAPRAAGQRRGGACPGLGRWQLADAQGVTPLAHAEQRGQRAIVEILRRAGARP